MSLVNNSRHVENRAYYPGIDGLRTVAVLSVMVYHLVPRLLPGGFIGVDIFFVISGFVVTGSMIRDRAESFPHFLAHFYARRFRRILPALVVMLVIAILVSFAFIPESYSSETISKTALAAFFGASNFPLAFGGDGYFSTRAELNPFTHTWSLAVEEQFYLVFPLLVFYGLHRPAKALTRALGLVVSALCVVSFGYCAWASSGDPTSAYYMLPSRFWELGVGAIAALLGDDKRRSIVATLGQTPLLIGGLALLLMSVCLADESHFPFPWAILPVVGSTALIVALSVDNASRIARLIGSRPMVGVGLLSYSLYLWHWPIFTVMRWTCGLTTIAQYAVAILATFACAALSYRLVELPTKNSRLITRLPNIGVVAASIAAICFCWLGAMQVYSKPWRFKMTTVERNKDDWYAYGNRSGYRAPGNCDAAIDASRKTVTKIAATNCQAGKLSGRTLFIAGDSHAGAYTRLAARAVAATGMDAVIYTMVNCPWASIRARESEATAECRTFRARALSEIGAKAHPGDVIFLASLRLPRLSSQDGLSARQIAERDTFIAHRDALRLPGEDDAAKLISRLMSQKLKVIIDLPKPVFKIPPFRCADWFNRSNPVCAPGSDVNRIGMERYRAPIVRAEYRLAGAMPGLVLYDPFPKLCPIAASCNAFAGNRPLFFDGDHLSGLGNDVLARSFVGVVRNAIEGQRTTLIHGP